VSIANWILHQSTSTHPLGRQTFVEKAALTDLEKSAVRPTDDLIDFAREQFFVSISARL